VEEWPEYDPELVKDDEFQLVCQVNGKVKATVSLDMGISESDAKEKALGEERVMKGLGGKEIKKVIFVKDRLINFVID